MEDWLEDIVEFGPDIVAEACGRWRRTETRRPTPADIRLICIEEQQARPSEDGEAAPVPKALPPDATRNGRLVDEEAYARSIGWSSMVERRDAIAAQEARLEAGRVWQAAHAAEMRGAGALRPLGAAAMGVTAREYTPEEMAAGRAALGITDQPPEESR